MESVQVGYVGVVTFGSCAKVRGTCIVVTRLRTKPSIPRSRGVAVSSKNDLCIPHNSDIHDHEIGCVGPCLTVWQNSSVAWLSSYT